MLIERIETAISINVMVKNVAVGLNFRANSTEFGINNKIIVPINTIRLNFIEPFSNENLNLSIVMDANPLNPNIDLIILFAVVIEVALK